MNPAIRIAWRVIPEGVARRAVAWALLSELLPATAVIDNPCPRCGGPHGPVRISGAPAVASVTYAGGIALVAVADSTLVAAIGIDAEPVADGRRDAAGMRGVLGPGAASIHSWTRVEAALKADGRGLRVDPATVEIRETPDGWAAEVPGGGVFTGWDAAGPPDTIVSVAARSVSAAGAGSAGPATR